MAKITNLTGTTWHIPAGWICEAGYGAFNLSGSISYTSPSGDINRYLAVTDSKSFTIGYSSASKAAANSLFYVYTPTTSLCSIDNTVAFTLNITGGSSVTDTELIEWLEQNDEMQSATSITYNGTEIASIEAGQTATLSCNGKLMLSDVAIAFGADGTITYDGTETSATSGQTATLSCAGKVMKSDVVVKVDSGELTDLTGTTWSVPKGWSATAGYGIFSVDASCRLNDEFDRTITSLSIGYKYNSDTQTKESGSNLILLNNVVYANVYSIVFTFNGGTDVKNTKLIDWLKQYGELQ